METDASCSMILQLSSWRLTGRCILTPTGVELSIQLSSIAGQVHVNRQGLGKLASDTLAAGHDESTLHQVERLAGGVAAEAAGLGQDHVGGAHIPAVDSVLVEGVCVAGSDRANVESRRAQRSHSMSLPGDCFEVLEHAILLLGTSVASHLDQH